MFSYALQALDAPLFLIRAFCYQAIESLDPKAR